MSGSSVARAFSRGWRVVIGGWDSGLILRDGAKDFFWNATIQELDHEEIALDIHQILLKVWCEQQGIRPAVNAIVNKTPISYKANRMIGAKAPSDYLAAI